MTNWICAFVCIVEQQQQQFAIANCLIIMSMFIFNRFPPRCNYIHRIFALPVDSFALIAIRPQIERTPSEAIPIFFLNNFFLSSLPGRFSCLVTAIFLLLANLRIPIPENWSNRCGPLHRHLSQWQTVRFVTRPWQAVQVRYRSRRSNQGLGRGRCKGIVANARTHTTRNNFHPIQALEPIGCDFFLLLIYAPIAIGWRTC